ncbi:MAG: peptidase S10 [Sphingobium sp.]|nr:peptidase S10 [Sphingobium sp.]
MTLKRLFSYVCVVAAGVGAVTPVAGFGAEPAGAPPQKAAAAEKADNKPSAEERQSVTKHSVTTAGGRTIAYTATAGTLTLKGENGTPEASMFYVAYVADGAKTANRPVTFFYNGGPGSSSIWLHMASFGPRRVPIALGMKAGSAAPLAPNPQTLLGETDMVFLDAIGTGYSDVLDASFGKNYWGNDQDAASFAQAIRRYLEKNDRWASPKYLFGESYGTTRSAITALKLHDSGVHLNGVILMSSILNFAQRAPGLDRMAINQVPTYAATAWHHGKIARQGSLTDHVERARRFASGPYSAALAKGHWLGDEERNNVAREMAELTGLSPEYLIRSDLQVMPDRFRKELMRAEGTVVGGLDTRFTGSEADGTAEAAATDPTENSIAGPIISAFNGYIARDLGYKSNQPYYPGSRIRNMFALWDWSHRPPYGARQNAMADVAIDLAEVMRRNPSMRVLSMSGYYDLSTPFFATEYDLSHMMLPADLRANLTERYYESGHMIYLDEKSLVSARTDIAQFLTGH